MVRVLKRVGQQLTSKSRRMIQPQSRSLPSSDRAVSVFFVVGMSRSGTTWLMRLLNSHPEVLCRGEGRFFGRDWGHKRLAQIQVRKQPSSLYGALSSSEYLRLWIERSVWSRDEDVEEHLANLTRAAIDYFLARKLSETGKRIVGDKTPLLAPGIVKEIGEIYPGAKVIHIVRDGRDQAVSLMHYLWNAAGDGESVNSLGPRELAKREAYREDPRKLLEGGEGIFAGKRLRRMATNWSTRVGETVEDGPQLLGDNYAEVRYEDLLKRPEEEVGRLFGFLGVEAGEEVVGRCVERASFERRAEGRERGEEDSTSRTFRKGVAGDWKNVFTERDKEVFKEVAGDLLVELGYEKDHNW